MKVKKQLFPYFLFLAVLLTGVGLISANISFSAPINNNYTFNVQIGDVESENINIISYDNSNISYLIELSEFNEEYIVSFDVLNDSDFNVVLDNTIISELPEELRSIIDIDIKKSNKIEKNNKDRVVISYKLKNNLTDEQIKIVNKYKDIKINAIFNYTQE